MKNLISFFSILSITIHSFAQVTMLDTVSITLPKNNMSYLLGDTIFNNTPNQINISWIKSADSLLPGVTCSAISDPLACFPFGAVGLQIFTMNPYDISAIYVYVKADTNAVNGMSYITVSTALYGDLVFKISTVPVPVSCSASFFMYEDTLAAPHTYIGINTCVGNNLTYDWSWGDGAPNSSGPYPSHTYPAAGIYNICVAINDSLACTDTFCSNQLINKTAAAWYTVTFNSPTVVIDKEIESLSVYPNPAYDLLFIYGENTMLYNVDIYSLYGTKVQSETVRGKESVNIVSLSKGMYLLKISNSKGEYQNIKFVKD